MANNCDARPTPKATEARRRGVNLPESELQPAAGTDEPGMAAQDFGVGNEIQRQTRVLVRLAQVIDSLSERALGLELSLGKALRLEHCPRVLDEELRTTYLSLASLRKRRCCVERGLGMGDEGTAVGDEPATTPQR